MRLSIARGWTYNGLIWGFQDTGYTTEGAERGAKLARLPNFSTRTYQNRPTAAQLAQNSLANKLPDFCQTSARLILGIILC
jgi:hypothetical protein